MSKERVYVFTDANQPELDESVPVPQTNPLEDLEGHRSAWGAFYREQWNRPFPQDAMVLRVVVSGEPGGDPEVFAELDFEEDWTAHHELVRKRGQWVHSGLTVYTHTAADEPVEPTGRQKRAANVDRHLPRLRKLLSQGLDPRLGAHGEWAEMLIYEWDLSGPRSRRGRQAELDPQEIDRLMTSGMTTREIAEKFGVHPGSIRNAMTRHRKRDVS